MAKRKKAQPWDAVFDRIRVRLRAPRDPEYVYPAPVTDVDLNELETHLGCRLPESYRTFMKRFGPGEAADLIRLPPLGVRDEGSYTLIADTIAYRGNIQIGEFAPSNATWLSRLVYFGSDCGDAPTRTEDVAQGGQQYRIHRLRRMQKRSRRRQETLTDLIQWAHRTLEAEEGATDIIFKPWGTVREKMADRAT